MSKKVTIIDYGVGNILSVTRAFEKCSAEVKVTNKAEDILSAEKIVIPGVGAFPEGMKALERLGLIEAIKKYAASGKPILGVCLGMQLLFEDGYEFGHHKGLGLIPGSVVSIPKTTIHETPHKIPHIGWNFLQPGNEAAGWDASILKDIKSNQTVYFVHSFMAAPLNSECCLAVTDYNGRVIPAVVQSGKVYGCQFHPEKSGPTGLKIIETFINT